MPEHPVDVTMLMAGDHRAVETLLTSLEAGPGDRSEILFTIVRELALHAGAEEVAVYPAARELLDDGDELVAHSLEEHQKVKDVLARLDGADPENAATQHDIETLKSLVQEHVHEEESVFLPRLREHASAERLAELGDSFLKAKHAVPTRPHPHAPNTPPGNVIGGAAARVLDKARDAVHELRRSS